MWMQHAIDTQWKFWKRVDLNTANIWKFQHPNDPIWKEFDEAKASANAKAREKMTAAADAVKQQ